MKKLCSVLGFMKLVGIFSSTVAGWLWINPFPLFCRSTLLHWHEVSELLWNMPTCTFTSCCPLWFQCPFEVERILILQCLVEVVWILAYWFTPLAWRDSLANLLQMQSKARSCSLEAREEVLSFQGPPFKQVELFCSPNEMGNDCLALLHVI